VHLSREAGWYDVNGNAVYVKANSKFADDDPAVRALPQIFDKISDDAPPGAVKAKVQAAKAAVTGKGASDG
jgi:hypothetical protein